MKTFSTPVLLIAVLVTSSSGMRKFDRLDKTSVERYNIVYKDNKCGLYDIQADSLVTAIKYDALSSAELHRSEDMSLPLGWAKRKIMKG